MSCKTLAGVLVLTAGASAQPSVVIELVPDNPGPYIGGESITVDVWAHSMRSSDSYIWYARLDFADSSVALDLDSTFAFDLSSSGTPGDFQRDLNLPIPWVWNSLEYACDPCRLQLPAGGSLHIGTIGVRLPIQAASFRLDVTNADDPDPTRGVLLQNNGSLVLRAFTGEIEGGVLDFPVTPAIPTVSEWGLAIMAMLIIAVASTLVARRARAPSNPSLISGPPRANAGGRFRALLVTMCVTGGNIRGERRGYCRAAFGSDRSDSDEPGLGDRDRHK